MDHLGINLDQFLWVPSIAENMDHLGINVDQFLWIPSIA